MRNFYFALVGLCLLISVATIVILFNDKKVNTKIITVDTDNIYLYDKNQKIEISIFTNDVKLPIDDSKSFNDIRVKNIDDNKSMKLEYIETTYSHTENFMGEDFYKYYLKFKMPNLNNNFVIEEAFLEIIFINNIKIQVSIGRFELLYLNDKTILDWNEVNSSKNIYNDFRISNVFINTEINLDIKSICIGSSFDIEYKYNGTNLEVIIPKDKYVLTYFPLIVETNDENVYYIPNFHYSEEYSLLNSTKQLINIYDFN